MAIDDDFLRIRSAMAGAPSGEAIVAECLSLAEMLVAKNKAYGDSAIHPIRVLSRANAEEQLRVRIDDKLSRLAKGDGSGDEDAIGDLLGYLVLLRISMGRVR